MITIKEEKIAELMFDIWHNSNHLKNPVMVGEYIAKKLNEVKSVVVPNGALCDNCAELWGITDAEDRNKYSCDCKTN